MHRPSSRSLIALLLAAAITVCGIWYFARPEPPPSPELGSPKLSLDALDAARKTKPLYFCRAALPWMQQHWGEWAKSYGNPAPAPEELAAEFDQGLQAPHLWRAMDRKWRFGAVLLTGDPVTFRPLLDALRTAPDWTLTRLDPTSYLFVRVEAGAPPRAWTAQSELAGLLAAFDQHPKREKIMARVQLAHRLIFLEDLATARTLLEEAFKVDPKSKEAWTELASLHGMSNNWPESAKAARRALSRDRDYRPAKVALANAEYGTGHFDAALELTRDLYANTPVVDGDLLLLHAKVTHAAHAFQEEAEVLQRLISLMQERSQPVGFWQIYLGQALSASGEPQLALGQFKNAQKDETLRPIDREFVEKAIERLNSREALPTVPSFGKP